MFSRPVTFTRLAAVLTACCTLAACATQYSTDREALRQQSTQQPVSEPVVEEPPRPVILPSATTTPAEPVRSLPAAIALRERADLAAEGGEHQKAIGLLERALRISPQDPLTYIALAGNNLAMNQSQQAMQLARRGLSLNPTDAQRQSLQNIVDQAQALQQ
jgi:tetratricopeptide (TPR) repeat protein